MTQFDRRSVVAGMAGAALVATGGTSTAQAGSAEEAARNKEILAQAYRIWHESRGDSVGRWMEIVDNDIAFGSLAEGRPAATFTAPIRGKETLKTYFAGLLEAWKMIHFTVDDFIAEGDRVAMIGSTAWRNNKTGKVFETRKVDIWRLRNGLAVEFYEYYDTAKLAAAAS
jgi:ketosteroid isomerase-like protein